MVPLRSANLTHFRTGEIWVRDNRWSFVYLPNFTSGADNYTMKSSRRSYFTHTFRPICMLISGTVVSLFNCRNGRSGSTTYFRENFNLLRVTKSMIQEHCHSLLALLVVACSRHDNLRVFNSGLRQPLNNTSKKCLQIKGNHPVTSWRKIPPVCSVYNGAIFKIIIRTHWLSQNIYFLAWKQPGVLLRSVTA